LSLLVKLNYLKDDELLGSAAVARAAIARAVTCMHRNIQLGDK
jgi:hypothetical protein